MLLGLLAAGCTRSKATGLVWPRTSTHEGIEFVELFPNDADERSPLIVAIHGRGDRPESFAEVVRSFPARVQIVCPRALDRYGSGWSWFEFKDDMTDDQFGAAVGAAETALWKGIAAIAAGRKMIVTGFSQGGFLTYALASRHPNEIVYGFPVGASCPGPLLPKEHAPAAPIVAFHGTADAVVDIKWGRAAVRGWQERGATASLHEYPGIGHAMPPQLRADLFAEIQKALPRLG
jgi:phospholipase/carboxylesterase